MGMNRMMRSVAIEKPELAYQNLALLMQVPSILLSNALVMGVHWKIVATTDATQ